jgi:hypothetical protein
MASDAAEEQSCGSAKLWREVSANYPQGHKEIPYDDLDPAIVELCKAINEFPGIITTESCQGFIGDHRPGEPWAVYFNFDGLPNLDGYASVEFLVWVTKREAWAAGFDTAVLVNAPPPYLNGICQSMYYCLQCPNQHPDEFAKFLREMRDQLFHVPVDGDPSEMASETMSREAK